MKSIKKKLFYSFTVVIVSFLLLLFALFLPLVQQTIIQKVTDWFSAKTRTELKVEHFSFSLGGSFTLTELLLRDQNADTLLYADTIQALFFPFRLYQNGKLSLDSVALSGLVVNITKLQKDSSYNFQFLLDAFPKDTLKPSRSSSFDLAILGATLSDCRFSHHIFGGGNAAANYSVRNINAHLKLGSIRFNHFDSQLYHLSATDSSGLKIDTLRFRFFSTGDSLLIAEDFFLTLPASQLKIPEANYSLRVDSFRGEISFAEIYLPDLKRYVSGFKEFKEPIHLSAHLEGTVPAMKIEKLNCSYGDYCYLSAQELFSSDLTDWKSADYNLSSQISFTTLFPQFLSSKSLDISSVFHLFPSFVQLTGDGKATDCRVKVDLLSQEGLICCEGRLKNSFEDNWTQFSLLSHIDSLHWQRWVGLPGHLPTSAEINLNGKWNWTKLPVVKLSAQFHQVDILEYVYAPIDFYASLDEDEIWDIELLFQDSLCDAVVSAYLKDWKTDSLRTDLSVIVKNVNPYLLHWTGEWGNCNLSSYLKIAGNGNNLTRWNGEILIDELRLKRDSLELNMGKTVLYQSPILHGNKFLQISAPFLQGNLTGNYDIPLIYDEFRASFYKVFPSLKPKDFLMDSFDNRYQMDLTLFHLEPVFNFFNKDYSLQDTLSLSASIASDSSKLSLSLSSFRMNDKQIKIPQLYLSRQKDSLQLKGDTRYQNQDDEELSAKFAFSAISDNVSGQISLLSLADSAMFHLPLQFDAQLARTNSGEKELFLNLDTIVCDVNHQSLSFSPSSFHWQEDRIDIAKFSLMRGDSPLISLSGVASNSVTDTLHLQFREMELSTLLTLLTGGDYHLNALLHGDIYASALLGDQMRFSTNNFGADSLRYNENVWGDLSFQALWDNSQKGISTRLALHNEQRDVMKVDGIFYPSTSVLTMDALIDSIPMVLFLPFVSEYISGLTGYVGSSLKVRGEIPNISLTGKFFFDKVKMDVRYSGTTYSLLDTIQLEKNRLLLSDFRIVDEKGNILRLNGELAHESFQKFSYQLTLNMNNFLLINSAAPTKNLLAGTFYANAKNLRLIGDNHKALVLGEFSNSGDSKLYINLPELPVKANRYKSIVYVEPKGDISAIIDSTPVHLPFDLSVDILLNLTHQSSFYLSLLDGAMIRGDGRIRLVYQKEKLSLYNRFSATDGYVKMRLSGLPQKKFLLKPGSYVEFSGTPQQLRFDATAIYQLTADLSTLSSSFSSVGLNTTRVPVDCELNAVGTLNKMDLSYNIKLPESSDEIVENVNSIINSDAIRIKEFAYLLGVGMFFDPSGRVKGDAFTSLASSSISSALNNALGSLWGDKVQLGAGFNSTKEDFSDLEMNLSLSTKFFNNRLLLKSSLGYQSQSADNGETSFLGNFDVEYLLSKSGMFRIKIYNHTNNEFYRTANNTQGIGFLFVKEGRSLRDLINFRTPKPSSNPEKSDTLSSKQRAAQPK